MQENNVLSNPNNEFINNGFLLIEESKHPIWSGSFNINYSIKKYRQTVFDTVINIDEINKTSDRWKIGEYQIIGNILLKELHLSSFSLESKLKWSFFRKKKTIFDFFELNGLELKLVENADFIDALLNLKDCGVSVKGQKSNIEFDFHLVSKENHDVKNIILFVMLMARIVKEKMISK